MSIITPELILVAIKQEPNADSQLLKEKKNYTDVDLNCCLIGKCIKSVCKLDLLFPVLKYNQI